jgi:TonB family protein
MYLDFEDYRPNIEPVGRALTGLEVVLLSIVFHLSMLVLLLVAPRVFPNLFRVDPARAQAALLAAERQAQPRFVFVATRNDLTAPKAPPRAEASDKDRTARSPESAKNPTNPLPFSRGNTPERVEAQARQAARGEGPAPSPAAGQPAQSSSDTQSDAQSALQLPAKPAAPQSNVTGHAVGGGGALGEALRNLGRYVQHDQFDNPGGAGQPGAAIQFDTKGVEFGPWLRRFVAQIKRNWFIPYAAMSMKGHVVITFNVHKNGAITDLTVVGPCPVDAFNNAAFGALVSSNPTQPLPPEYPDEKAFFTVTFYYNEGQP